ncbi:hypothetical protein [Bacillus pinisoli]|uniref:hypothetical protein n=1 Tax=Bacillus pinisoli TaxID=2901866 RepID=UPI001FF5C823|nr:hypothetical protein [Bacillus pinisoli]
MKNSILITTIILFMFTMFKKRYRVLNSVLRNPLFRKLAVKFAMQIPFVREQFLRQAFR